MTVGSPRNAGTCTARWRRCSARYSDVMSAENLEVVRAMYERRERGDMDVAEFVDPEIVFARIGSELPDVAGEWHGLDGMRKATVEYLNVWEDYRFEVERMIELGDRVLVLSAIQPAASAAVRSSTRTSARCSPSVTA